MADGSAAWCWVRVEHLIKAVKNLPPVYFAMVMSTGIVSIAFRELGFDSVSLMLFYINVVTYGLLFPMLLARMAFFTSAFLKDLKSPMLGFGFLTFVAGTNTLGVQFLILDFVFVAKVLWAVAFVGWFLFMYSIFINFIAFTSGPVENAINGASLLTTVSTQSVAVLGSMLAEYFGALAGIVLFVSWAYWAAGFVLYIIVIILVAYRLLFRVMKPEDWTGPYWICMGAVAITTLAGANLAMKMSEDPALAIFSPATIVVTFLAWAIGTWWIPIQVFMDIWKFTRIHLSNKVPAWIRIFPWLRLGFGRGNDHFYEPLSWGRVFPMGMYTACTIALSKASRLEFLFLIPKYWGWFALSVWILTFMGTLRSVLRSVQDLVQTNRL